MAALDPLGKGIDKTASGFSPDPDAGNLDVNLLTTRFKSTRKNIIQFAR